MRKIVGFKLEARRSAVERRAKKLGLALPENADAFMACAYAAMKPAVLFNSFPKPSAEEAGLSPVPGLGYSLILAGLGDTFAAHQAASADAPLLGVVEEIALEDAGRFAASLIEQEAVQEACELSPLSLLNAEALALVLAKLDGSKIGVSLVEGSLKPSCARAWGLSWLAKSKSRSKSK